MLKTTRYDKVCRGIENTEPPEYDKLFGFNPKNEGEHDGATP